MTGVPGARRRGGQVSAFEGEMVERPCITCGETFESQGAHNRMCDPCRRYGGRTVPEHSHALPARGGRAPHA